MAKIEGIQYVVDEKGRRKAVIMSYRRYLRLMEDLDDLTVALERRDEKPIPFESVIAELKSEGRL